MKRFPSCTRPLALSAFLLAAPAFVGVTTVTTAAHADANTDKAVALLKSGKSALEKKKWAEALKDLEGSYAIVPSPNSLIYIARAYVGLGDLPMAYATFDRVIREADAKGDPKYKDTRASAVGERDELAGKLLLVDVKVANTAAGTIKLGSVSVGPEGWGSPVPAPAGIASEISLTLPNGVVVRQSVTGQAGQRVSVLLDASPSPVGGPPPPPPPPPQKSGGGGINILVPVGAGVAALGVGGMIAFAITGSNSQSIYDDLLRQCGGTPCPSVDQSKVNDGKTQQTIANVSLGIGVVALAAGGALMAVGFIQGPPKKKEAARVVPVIAPGYVGAFGKF